MDMFIFAKRLKECRINKNVSAVDLGRAIGLDASTIHRYEKAKYKSIKQSRLEDIASYLGVDSDYLIGNTNEKYNYKLLEKLKEKQNLEITTILYITKELIEQNNVVLDGKPIRKELLEPICENMEITIELARRKNK